MTQNQNTELLPCPFCGGEAETHMGMKPKQLNGKTVDWPYKIVKCKNNCDRLSVEGWNTRPAKAVQGDKAEALEYVNSCGYQTNGNVKFANCSVWQLHDWFEKHYETIRAALTPESEVIAGKGEGRARSMQILEVGKDKWGEPLTVMGTANAIAALARLQAQKGGE